VTDRPVTLFSMRVTVLGLAVRIDERRLRPRAVPRALLLWLLICGTLGPLLFDAVYLIEGATRPGYDGWQQAISTLSLGPGGWLQQANFIGLGVLTVAVAIVWRRILKGGVGRDLVSDHARDRRVQPDHDRLLLN